MTEKKMKRLIYKYLRKYKHAMKIKDRLKIEGIIFSEPPDGVEIDLARTSNEDLFYDNKFIYINPQLFSLNDSVIYAVLCHEFTHIYDGIRLRKQIDNIDDFYRVICFYTEFHAKYVELQTALNVNPTKIEPCLYSDVDISTTIGNLTIIDILTGMEADIYHNFRKHKWFDFFVAFTSYCGAYKFYNDYFIDSNRKLFSKKVTPDTFSNMKAIRDFLFDFEEQFIAKEDFSAILRCPYLN